MYKSVVVCKGAGGWGGPITLIPTAQRHVILSVTGGGIHPIAKQLGELSGCEVVDGFTTGVNDSEILAVVIDCGGTARCGVYPRKGIHTINVVPVGRSGPLSKYITEDLYVSGVTPQCLAYASKEAVVREAAKEAVSISASKEPEKVRQSSANIVTRMGIGIGQVVNKFYAAGRESIDITIKSILPFMAFVSMILGIITATGVGNVVAVTISPVAASLPGMLILALVCALPFISPVLGPGAVIAQVIGTLLGAEIGLGHIPPQYALPALFAIDAQVGADFIPVGLSLGEAEPETIELGVPAVLYSRMITGPLAVLLAYASSVGLY